MKDISKFSANFHDVPLQKYLKTYKHLLKIILPNCQ